MRKLSAYTIASNCSDIVDICDGLLEIYQAMRNCRLSYKKVPIYYSQRAFRLKKKLETLMMKSYSFDKHVLTKLESLDNVTRRGSRKYSEIAIHKNKKQYENRKENQDNSLYPVCDWCATPVLTL